MLNSCKLKFRVSFKIIICPILVRFAHAICSLRERDIVSCCETAICSPVANVVESTLPINPHAAQFAAYRAAGISLAQGKYRKSVRIYIALVCLLRQTN